MPRKIEIEHERDELRARIEAARAILDDALGLEDEDEEEDDEDSDDDYDGPLD